MSNEITYKVNTKQSRYGNGVEVRCVTVGARPSWRKYNAKKQGAITEAWINNGRLSLDVEEWYEDDLTRKQTAKRVMVELNEAQTRAIYDELRIMYANEPFNKAAHAHLLSVGYTHDRVDQSCDCYTLDNGAAEGGSMEFVYVRQDGEATHETIEGGAA